MIDISMSRGWGPTANEDKPAIFQVPDNDGITYFSGLWAFLHICKWFPTAEHTRETGEGIFRSYISTPREAKSDTTHVSPVP